MTMTRLLGTVVTAAAALSLSACAFFNPERIPMRTQEYRLKTDSPAHTLLVMLPGRFSSPDHFRSEGFVEMVRAAGFGLDVMTVDANISYYYDQSIVERLRADVIIPARERGYRSIWVLGVSMGGMGAIWYDRSHPGELDGLILLSPYLGDKSIVDEVEAAGGLRSWHQDTEDLGRFPEDIWGMTKGYADRRATAGRLFLGYGLQDSLARSNALLGKEMPADQVVTLRGDHDWPTWRLLLASLLENRLVRRGLDPLQSR
jgi:pimeloyl-ACP methyl ester carboxylesterase